MIPRQLCVQPEFWLIQILMLVMIMGLIGLIAPPDTLLAQSTDTAQLYLRPVALSDEKFTDLILVEVVLENVIDLYGAEIELQYDRNRLNVQDSNDTLDGTQIGLGTLFPNPNRFIGINQDDATTGTIRYAITLLPPAPAIQGDGVLATVAFRLEPSANQPSVSAQSPPTVTITAAQLVSTELTLLPLTVFDQPLELTHPSAVEADDTSAAVLPEWGWWVIIISGSILLCLSLILLSLKRLTSITASTATRQHPMPKPHPASNRTSTLLTQQGQQALQRGDSPTAYTRFNQAITRNPTDVEAWFGKGLVAQNETEKRLCFERVLSLEPTHQKAQAELETLSQSTLR